jgi:hypothetical protein
MKASVAMQRMKTGSLSFMKNAMDFRLRPASCENAGTGRNDVLLALLLPITLLAITCCPSSSFAQESYLHHDFTVTLAPEEHGLTVVDSITLPKDHAREVRFTLHKGLAPSSPTPAVRIERRGEKQAAVPLESHTVILPPGLNAFVITYGGSIYHPVGQAGEEQARGFSETPGIISPQGVYLSGNSGWYPDFGSPLVTFALDVRLPKTWDAVSQGTRSIHDRGENMTYVRWHSPEPQDAIFLIAAPFTFYAKSAGQVQAMAFLRSPDQGLADKYLDATIKYLDMYDRLIGPYPYKKFALVENFWETGFGMPSFTLLGPKVVRLPFIINTSYPHEILHNWWGNSVYADYEKGNWSEGLTAYLSDYLMKEQQGGGTDYRITTLQKYADYVRGNKDFPLTDFRSRHSPSTEAVGYGKALMFFHMLRLELGDDNFKKGLREFYGKYKFRFASFEDIRSTFESVSGRNLKPEFGQWIKQSGAPRLKVSKAVVSAGESGVVLSALLEQTQPGDAYVLRIPLAVSMEGRERAFQTVIEMTEKRLEFRLPLPAMPQRLDIDPEFDLFRRLDSDEMPPAVSQALGAKKMLVILPSAAGEDLLRSYREFSGSLAQSGPDEVEVKLDSEITTLPFDRAVTILGWENRFIPDALEALFGYDVAVKDRTIRINQATFTHASHSFVLTSRSPKNPDMALSLMASDRSDALPGLARKLPHYHKYSYLAFEGTEPANVAKGRWPVVDSPLTVFIPDKTGAVRKVAMAQLAPREPLASPESPFSKERMIETVRFLSSEDLAGRGFGSPGLDKAADYIATQFKDAGLMPAGDEEGSFFQIWEESNPPLPPFDKGGMGGFLLKNVIAVIPGKKPELQAQSVVIGAHYDHLGLGWPETRDKKPGKIHPGADDNASGVAVLIELARALSKGPKPDRTIVFVAFSGEESGRRGSKYYSKNMNRWPVKDCIGMVNLDTVGRLGKNKLLVLGAGSAREWVHLFRGAGFVTGVDIETVSAELDSSDQKSFQEAGVPAVQLFSGPNLDYHRSTDTADKIDPDGLVKVASVAKEALEYLAERPGSLTAPSQTGRTDTAQTGPRKVGLGTIPDFAYDGKGFRLSGVVPGSPAEAAGLREGDILIRMNDASIGNLKDFSDILKTLKPGDTVSIIYLRDGKERDATAVVKER